MILVTQTCRGWPASRRPAERRLDRLRTGRSAIWRLTFGGFEIGLVGAKLKIGTSSCGAKVQPVPPLSRLSRSPLALPTLVVSEMRGKNAARASDVGVGRQQRLFRRADVGRLVSSSDGSPGGTSDSNAACAERPGPPAGRSTARLTEQQHERVPSSSAR